MNDCRPPPLTPPDCDLRGYEFLPFFFRRFLNSRFYALARRNPRAGLAGMTLWAIAWEQIPTASLPPDDFDLAGLAGFGDDVDAWRAAKPTALHGFVECCDGRLYHQFLAQEAVKAFAMRLKADKRRAADRERLRQWREEQKNARCRAGSVPAAVIDTSAETHFDTSRETRLEMSSDTHFETANETPDETRFVAADRTVQDRTIPKKDSMGATKQPSNGIVADGDSAKNKASKGSRLPTDWQPDAEDIAFARKGGLDVALVAPQFRDFWIAKPGHQGRKVDWRATWRNWCRGNRGWVDPDAARPSANVPQSKLFGRPMRTAEGRVLTESELFEVGT